MSEAYGGDGPDLPLFPEEPHAVARHGDPETSHEAAASISPDVLRASQVAVFDCFVMFGMPVCDETAYGYYQRNESLKQSPSGFRTRRSELVRQGKLVHDGYGTTPSGRRTRLWRLA